MSRLSWTAIEITAEQTHSVRRAVLRADTPGKEVVFAEDEWPGAFHLGVIDDGRLVATSSWIPRPAPGRPDEQAIQLRGMATTAHLQGRGVGAALIAAGRARARAAGITHVWANARDAALAFYLREGFEVDGDGFVDATTQLPHHRVISST